MSKILSIRLELPDGVTNAARRKILKELSAALPGTTEGGYAGGSSGWEDDGFFLEINGEIGVDASPESVFRTVAAIVDKNAHGVKNAQVKVTTEHTRNLG
jgi:hypothetical protein